MIGASKILTVSYGTFSCTLEGFDEPFNTMKAIAEYFRDLAAEDRYFGAEPPTPDAAMLHRIAEREIHRRVEAKIQENGVILRAEELGSPERPAMARPAPAPTVADAVPEGVAARLMRARSAAAEAQALAAPEESADTGPNTGYDEDDGYDPALLAVANTSAMNPVATEAVEPEVHTEAAPVAAEAGPVEAEAALEAAPEAETVAALAEVAPVEVEATVEAETVEAVAEVAPVEAEAVLEAETVEAVAEVAPVEAETVIEAALEVAAEPVAEPMPEAEAMVETVEESLDIEATQYYDEEAAMEAAEAQAEVNAADFDAEAAMLARAAQPVEDTVEAEAEAAEEDLLADEDTLRAILAVEPESPAEAPVAEEAAPVTEDDDFAGLLAQLATPEPEAAIETAEPEPVIEAEPQPEPVAEAQPEAEPQPEPVAEAQPKPVAEAQPEPQPAPEAETALSEKAQRARARVIRIRRADPAPVAEATSTLSPEAEADLARELAALQGSEAPQALPTRAAPPPEAEDADLAAALADPAPMAAEAPKLADLPTPEADTRKRLEPATGEDSVKRLIAQTNSELAGPENRRRLSAIAHLKAAVAATVADRRAGAAPAETEAERIDPYRNDLARAVRPRRPGMPDSAPGERPAPLVLVSEQRIDRPVEAAPVAPVRPRRVTSGAATARMIDPEPDLDDEDGAEDAANIFTDARGFAEFAERLGATDLPDLLEAAAAYTSCVEGRPHFSRPQLLHLVSGTQADPLSREDSLRSFGRLMRMGRIIKLKRGQFVLTDRSHLLAEARKMAQ